MIRVILLFNYGRYTESGQNNGHFAFYLEECGIKVQYIIPDIPEKNEVSKKKK